MPDVNPTPAIDRITLWLFGKRISAHAFVAGVTIAVTMLDDDQVRALVFGSLTNHPKLTKVLLIAMAAYARYSKSSKASPAPPAGETKRDELPETVSSNPPDGH